MDLNQVISKKRIDCGEIKYYYIYIIYIHLERDGNFLHDLVEVSVGFTLNLKQNQTLGNVTSLD